MTCSQITIIYLLARITSLYKSFITRELKELKNQSPHTNPNHEFIRYFYVIHVHFDTPVIIPEDKDFVTRLQYTSKNVIICPYIFPPEVSMDISRANAMRSALEKDFFTADTIQVEEYEQPCIFPTSPFYLDCKDLAGDMWHGNLNVNIKSQIYRGMTYVMLLDTLYFIISELTIQDNKIKWGNYDYNDFWILLKLHGTKDSRAYCMRKWSDNMSQDSFEARGLVKKENKSRHNTEKSVEMPAESDENSSSTEDESKSTRDNKPFISFPVRVLIVVVCFVIIFVYIYFRIHHVGSSSNSRISSNRVR